MFSYHHYQVDRKSDPLAIEGQDWQISQNIPPSWTLSHENSFSHFTATDDRFSDEASGLSLTLPKLPRIPRPFAKLLVPLAVFLYCPRSRNLWNAKLTETRIFRELSIEIESSLIELKSSLIQLKSSLIQLESSLILLESSLIQWLSSLYMYN